MECARVDGAVEIRHRSIQKGVFRRESQTHVLVYRILRGAMERGRRLGYVTTREERMLMEEMGWQ